jgi:hypothetical protein
MGSEPLLLQLVEVVSSCFGVLPRFLGLFLRVCKLILDIIESGVIKFQVVIDQVKSDYEK